MNKTQQLKACLRSGDLRGALRIAAGFRREFDKDEQRTIQIAHECLVGNAGFYRQLGIDAGRVIADAEAILHKVYSCTA